MHDGILFLGVAHLFVSGLVLDVLVECGGLGNRHARLAGRLRGGGCVETVLLLLLMRVCVLRGSRSRTLLHHVCLVLRCLRSRGRLHLFLVVRLPLAFESDPRDLSVPGQRKLLFDCLERRRLGLLEQNEQIFCAGPHRLLAVLRVSY